MKTTTNNAVSLGLTAAQSKVFELLRARQKAGQVTTRQTISEALQINDKSWTCRILKSMIEKGAIERYDQRYYRLPA